MLQNSDIAKLFLRISLGVLLLCHGVHKLIYGVDSIIAMLAHKGIPEFFAYGVYVGELIAPLFIILGLYARVASLVVSINMLFAIYVAYGFYVSFTKYGALTIETPLLYLIMALLLFLLGSGKYSVNAK